MHRTIAISLLCVAGLAQAQFFNAPAMAVVMLVGQKQACGAAYPDLVQPLQAAFVEFANRNNEAVPSQKLIEIDASGSLAKSPAFAKVLRLDCENLVTTMPSVSLAEMAKEQERLNTERAAAEKRQR